MKNLNKKGVGLVMAIMIITVLLIMASGFFVVTSYMTKSTQSELERVRLYWAAESGSNYSVQWWTAQEPATRIAWPYYYIPTEEAKYSYSGDYNSGLFVEAINGKDNGNHDYNALYGGMGGIGGDSDIDVNKVQQDSTETGDDWYDWMADTDAAGYTENWDAIIDASYHDTEGHEATMENVYALGYLPEVCNGVAKDNKFYLNSSSEKVVLNYPNSSETYTLYLLRYKGERVDKAGAAVWVMDTWAVDSKTNETYRVIMSKLYNFKTVDCAWLQYNEGIINTMWSSGFNGRKGVYKDYDYRFGHSYFSEQVRFDYQTQTGSGATGGIPVGPKFYGQIHSASDEASIYKNSLFTSGLYDFDQGLYAEGQFADEAEAAAAVNGSVLGGWDHMEDLDVDNLVWSWDAVVANSSSSPTGIYLLSSSLTDINGAVLYPTGSEIGIVLGTETGTDGELITKAEISIITVNNANSTTSTLVETVEVSGNGVQAIAVPTEFGAVSISGNSSDTFSLITEEDIVKVTDDLYLTELESLRLFYENYEADQLADPTLAMLSDMYEQMYDIYPDAHLSVMSGLALTAANIEDYEDPAGGRSNQLDFTGAVDGFMFMTAGFYLGTGDLGVESGNSDLGIYNIGSMIIGAQGETTGSNSIDNGSSEVGIVFIQDKRFYDEDFSAGTGWGSGPEQDGVLLRGLNNNYQWTGGMAGKHDDLSGAFDDLFKN